MIGLWLRLKLTVWFGFLAALFVWSCGTDIDPALQKEPSFHLGYGDGCTTANKGVSDFKNSVKRNDDLYDQDKAYKAGWNNGFASCGGKTNADKDVFGGEDRWYTSGPLNP